MKRYDSGGSYASIWRKKYQNKGQYLFEKGTALKQTTKELNMIQKSQRERDALRKCTFKPELISKGIRDEDYECITEKTKKWQEEQRRRVVANQKAKEVKEVDGCTFHPVTNDPISPRGYYDSLSVFNRNMEWNDRRELKLQEQLQRTGLSLIHI
eukprot:TRINITY_DN11095_c0_g1_i1.p1 TRINITY_DN11095_c0_g1~~TRINITY_DN11095_c0_g1_i1.p1  ORF type:complete len:155 (-),score=24.68 TRINITY_DN11095_c0_g1_i1:61-525(-)